MVGRLPNSPTAHAFTTNLSQSYCLNLFVLDIALLVLLLFILLVMHSVLSFVPVESHSLQAAAMGLDLPVRTFNGTDALDSSFPNL